MERAGASSAAQEIVRPRLVTLSESEPVALPGPVRAQLPVATPPLQSAPVAVPEPVVEVAPLAPEIHASSISGKPRMAALTVAELAARLKVARTTIYGWPALGCPVERTPAGLRFDLETVGDWRTKRPGRGANFRVVNAARTSEKTTPTVSPGPSESPTALAPVVPSRPAPAQSPSVLVWVSRYHHLRLNQVAAIEVPDDLSSVSVMRNQGAVVQICDDELTPASREMLLPAA